MVVFFIPKIVSADVVINEILYDPDGADTDKEYVRLYNNGDSDVNLTNWDLDPSSAPYFTFSSFTLKAKSFVNIHINTSGTNSDTDLYDGGSSNMSNTKGPIALFNSTTHSSSTIIDYIEYGEGGQTNESKAVSAGIWTTGDFVPDAPEGKVIKLKINGVDNNSSSDWKESEPTLQPPSEEAGSGDEEVSEETPSSETPPVIAGNNPPIADAGDNIIAFIDQEISFDGSNCSDTDGNELAYSWNMGDGKLIEEPSFTYKYLYPGTYLVTLMVYDGLYYVSDTITVKIQSQEITINEFIPNPEGDDEENEWIEIYNGSNSIVDISGWQLADEASGSQPFTFPQNTLIAPKSYIVFPRPITKVALNNEGDSVRLLLPEGVVFQEVQYSKAKQGQSSANTPEGFVWSIPTPGIANVTYPEAIGGNPGLISKETTFDYEIEPQITKEPSQDYAWRYEAPDEKTVESEKELSFTETIQQDAEKQLAMIPSKKALAKITEPEKTNGSTQSTMNLVLMIAAVILGAFIIGLLITKFLKRSP